MVVENEETGCPGKHTRLPDDKTHAVEPLWSFLTGLSCPNAEPKKLDNWLFSRPGSCKLDLIRLPESGRV